MFRPIRRKNREIDASATKALLHESRRGVIAVNGDDGYPYAVPINYLYDEDAQRIYFHGARAGHKYDALCACDKVCFTVYGHATIKDEAWAPYMQSAIAFGRCHMLDSGADSDAILLRLAMKYYPEESLARKELEKSGAAVQLYAITIEHLTGKEVQEK